MVFHEVYLPAAVQICNISTAHISFLLPILSPEPTSLVLTIKSWPNEVASYRKLETCINLRLRLAMTCVYLRWLAMTCVHFDRAQICMNASFSPFGHPTQVDASWSQYCSPALYGRACKAALKWLSC